MQIYIEGFLDTQVLRYRGVKMHYNKHKVKELKQIIYQFY